jgi:hypothetical protein
MFERLKEAGFDVVALHHAEAILAGDMPDAVAELEDVLSAASVPVVEIIGSGGGEAQGTQRLRRALAERGWETHTFRVRKIIDELERESNTHKIDHVKRFRTGVLALEIEWNNKDTFYDRDLATFKSLHADGVISIGIIVTRGKALHDGLRAIVEAFAETRGLSSVAELTPFYRPTPRQQALIEAAAESLGSFPAGWAKAFVSDKFGEATTHWRKLQERVDRGLGNPCPLVLIGLPRSLVVDEPADDALTDE